MQFSPVLDRVALLLVFLDDQIDAAVHQRIDGHFIENGDDVKLFPLRDRQIGHHGFLAASRLRSNRSGFWRPSHAAFRKA